MRKNRLPPLNALRAFEAAARHSSFRLAADELGVGQSAISHQIRELEMHLGTRLFLRDGRGVRPSEAGLRLLPFLVEAFGGMTRGIEQLRAGEMGEELPVQIYITMAVRWLIPRLERLEQAHKGLRLGLRTTQRDWELDRSAAEVGVLLLRDGLAPTLHGTCLHKAELCAVTAAGRRPPGPFSPSWLQEQRFLQVHRAREDWRALLERFGLVEPVGSRVVVFDSYLLAMEAAGEGRGVALVPDFLVERDIVAGRLEEIPIQPRIAQPGEWWLVWSERMDGDPGLQALERFLKEEFAARNVTMKR